MAEVTRQEFMRTPITQEMCGKEILINKSDLVENKLDLHVRTFWVFRRQFMGVWRELVTNKPAARLQRAPDQLVYSTPVRR